MEVSYAAAGKTVLALKAQLWRRCLWQGPGPVSYTHLEFALESNINLLAEKVGISPWEIRYRNAIEPGKVLPNGQIADCSTALKETLLAVKDAYESNPGRAGIACAMKNAGVGVGLPDKGRARLIVEDGKIHIHAGASCIGQGLGTVLVQMVDVYKRQGLGRSAPILSVLA